MSAARQVTLNLAGRKVTLRTEAADDYVQGLTGEVEARIERLRSAGAPDAHAAALLAALELAHELHRALDERTRDESELGGRLEALITQLEHVTTAHER